MNKRKGPKNYYQRGLGFCYIVSTMSRLLYYSRCFCFGIILTLKIIYNDFHANISNLIKNLFFLATFFSLCAQLINKVE